MVPAVSPEWDLILFQVLELHHTLFSVCPNLLNAQESVPLSRALETSTLSLATACDSRVVLCAMLDLGTMLHVSLASEMASCVLSNMS